MQHRLGDGLQRHLDAPAVWAREHPRIIQRQREVHEIQRRRVHGFDGVSPPHSAHLMKMVALGGS